MRDVPKTEVSETEHQEIGRGLIRHVAGQLGPEGMAEVESLVGDAPKGRAFAVRLTEPAEHDAMPHLLRACPRFFRPFLRRRPSPFSIGFRTLQGEVQAVVWARDREMEEWLRGAFVACYGDSVELEPAESTLYLTEEDWAAGGVVRMARDRRYPLTGLAEFPSEPLGPLLTAIQPPNRAFRAAVQLDIEFVRGSRWASERLARAIERRATEGDVAAPRRRREFEAADRVRRRRAIFSATCRYAVLGKGELVLPALYRIESVFNGGVYDSDLNGLVARRLKWFRRERLLRFLAAVLARDARSFRSPRLRISAEELAVFFHPSDSRLLRRLSLSGR